MDPSSHVAGDPVPRDGRVVVFRALPGLGDFLCAVPSFRALRAARPDVEIALVGLRDTAPLAARFGRYIDRFLPFPGFPGLPERRPDVRRIPGFLAAVQSWNFDLAIQLHGAGEVSNHVVGLFGARRAAGHYPKHASAPDASLFLPWTEECSEVRRGLRLMAHLGWESDDERLEFPIDPAAAAEVDALAERDVLRSPYVVLHPGASTANRRWPAASFAAVADDLAAAGYAVVLTGSREERDVTASVAAAMHAPVLDLAGRTGLDALAIVLRGAALLVCNDTGVSHLAAALRVPSVVIFRDSSVERWAPLDRRLHRVAEGRVRHVLSEARRLLRSTEPHAA
ncbi:MAG TPA: glycosyltransferase family 9 protein [Candidatus Limnocylindrales bacterium]|nr:glycosyltransferase family 9 protein [Candidatus Limnocylindrales bacterium]